jgi:uncharacterized protein YrrD
MLHLAHKVTGATVMGVDGEIGTLQDFLIASDPWRVRFLLVETGGTRNARVLIPAASVRQDWDRTTMSVDLTVDQARSGVGFERDRDAAPSGSLRSVKESTGYHLQATNGEIGHVDDYLIRQENMQIPYLLVDTSNWIGGRSVIVSSEALDRVDNDRGLLYVEATRDAIRDAPSLDSIDSAIHTLETGPPFTII